MAEMIAGLLIGLLLGAGACWLALRSQIAQAADSARRDADVERATLATRLEARDRELAEHKSAADTARQSIAAMQQQLAHAQSDTATLRATLQKEREQTAEKLTLLQQAEQKLTDAFKALAAEALASNNQSFLTVAKTTLEKYQETARLDLEKRQEAIGAIVAPVKQSLDKVDAKIQALETAREGAYRGLSQQMLSLLETERQLRSETANLVKALRAPNVRGRWGEMQLRRVVELAGMVDHCDFHEQVSSATEDGGALRPDLIVRLPGGASVVVDAKTPLNSYLEAFDATDDQLRQQKLKDHARQVQNHVASLSKKAYWEQFQPSPDFVIMFLPGESFFDAAREHDPSLVEAAVTQRVMIATPISLITLLRTVAVGWRQEALARNAQEICDLGKTLYKRLATLGEHMAKLGNNLDKAVDAYNKSIGSLETNVLVSARRFRDLGAADGHEEIEDQSPVDKVTRKIQRKELLADGDSAAASVESVDGTASVIAGPQLRLDVG